MESKANKADNERYRQQLAVFSRAARELITEKLVSPEMEEKMRIMNVLQQYTANSSNEDHGVCNKDSNKHNVKKSVNVNVTNVKSETPKESLIFSVEMSEKDAPSSKVATTKRSKRDKRRGKKTKMTITSWQSSPGMNQQITITKDKTGSLLISGVSIQEKEQSQSREADKTKCSPIKTNEGKFRASLKFNQINHGNKIKLLLYRNSANSFRGHRYCQISMHPLSR